MNPSLKQVANTVEMAASSSKLLQIARKMDRTGNDYNKIRKKQTIPDPLMQLASCPSRILGNPPFWGRFARPNSQVQESWVLNSLPLQIQQTCLKGKLFLIPLGWLK